MYPLDDIWDAYERAVITLKMNKSFQVQKVETHFSKMSIDLFSIYFIAQCIDQKSA